MGWVPEGCVCAFHFPAQIQINPGIARKGHARKYVDMKALPTSATELDEFVWKAFYAAAPKFVNDGRVLARIYSRPRKTEKPVLWISETTSRLRFNRSFFE